MAATAEPTSWLEPVHPRAGVALVAGTWTRWLSIPGFFFVLALGWMLTPLTVLFIWTTAAEGGSAGGIDGMDRGEFVAYYLILVAAMQITRTENRYHVGGAIYSGAINAQLLRPMPPLYEALAADAGYTVTSSLTVLPFVGVLALVLHPTLHPTAWQAAWFVPALALGWALSFFWSLALALLAFWVQKVGALYRLESALVFLVAGQVAPVRLLPNGLQPVALALPFRYMAAFPAEILTGQLGPGAVAFGFAVQAAWLVCVLCLAALLWSHGVRRYAAVGG
jgi:ABC-2 type transport system permease protein